MGKLSTSKDPANMKESSNKWDIDNLSVRHLAIRSPILCAVIKIRETVLRSVRDFFYCDDWTEVTIPTIDTMAGSCEDYSSVFLVDYYGKKAF